jgi:hypothetical protein
MSPWKSDPPVTSQIVLARDPGIALHVRWTMIGMKHLDAAQSRIRNSPMNFPRYPDRACPGEWDAPGRATLRHPARAGSPREHRARSAPHKWAPFRPGSGGMLRRNWPRSLFGSICARNADARSRCGPAAPLRQLDLHAFSRKLAISRRLRSRRPSINSPSHSRNSAGGGWRRKYPSR